MSPPSEASPLLKAPETNGHRCADGTSGSSPMSGNNSNGTFTASSDADGAALERQTSADERRLRQYEGNKAIAKKMKWIIPAVGIGIFMASADMTLVVSSYGKIGSDLKELNKTSWIATAYFLTLTSFQPLYGKLSDIFGRKATLLTAYVLFGLGCTWCGLVRSMDELIFARAFAGIGGGGMSTVVSILMSDIVPLKDRGMWQGIINLIWASGGAIGAPLGGIMADTVGWRWAFLGQGPMCLLSLMACYFVLDLPTAETSHWTSRLRRVDFLGAFTLVATLGLLLTGLDRGSNVSWNDTITISTLSASAFMCITFVVVEARITSEPFAPGRVIFGRSMTAGFLCNFFAFAGNYSLWFYTPLYFQGVDAVSAFAAGIRLLPGVLAGVVGSLTAGLIMRRTGKFYLMTMAGYLDLTFASCLMVLFTGGMTSSTVGIIVSLVLAAWGNGCSVTTSLIALIANADPQDQAIATACSYLFRSLGSVLGLAFISSFFQQQLRMKLNDRLSVGGSDVKDIVRKVRESLEYIDTLPPQRAQIVRDTYGECLRHCFMLIAAFALCAFISSIFIREKKLVK